MTPKHPLRSALCQRLTVGLLYALLFCAYAYSAVLADIGDTVLGPTVVQDALRAFIIVQIGRSLSLRWAEFNFAQRLLWFTLAAGLALNMARGHFSGTDLTLSFFLLHVGMMGLTWRLMNTPWREVELARQNAAQAKVIESLQEENNRLREQLARREGAA